jgi:hypothetical protein
MPKRLSVERIKRRGNLLCDVEDGSNTSFYEASPITGVILRPYPYTWDDLYRTINVWYRRRTTVFIFPQEKGSGWIYDRNGRYGVQR